MGVAEVKGTEVTKPFAKSVADGKGSTSIVEVRYAYEEVRWVLKT
jgi:hypothetical protein